jgi:hypothetical protein
MEQEPGRGHASVLAEIEVVSRRSSERITNIPLAAFAAQIEALVVIDVVAYLLVLGVVQSIEYFLNLLQMIAILVQLILDRIERGIDFQTDNVAQFILRIDGPPAAIARVMNHHTDSPKDKGPVQLTRHNNCTCLYPSEDQ